MDRARDRFTVSATAPIFVLKSEEWLRLAAEGSQLGLWYWDEVSQELFWDARTREMLYAPATGPVTLETFARVLHPEDRDNVIKTWRRKLESELPVRLEYRVQKSDGEVRWIQSRGSSYCDDAGNPLRTVGVVFDITDRRSAEATLSESEERFRTMADTAPVMIWVSDQDKLCTFLNKVWLEFTGRTMEQELGEGWAEGVHPDDLDRCLATYSASFDARRRFRMEYRLRRADGAYRWVLDDGVPRFKSGGIFSGYIGSCIDITDVKRIQEEAVASQKLESLGQLARGVAHDFNNLLSGIHANAELALADRTESSSSREELLDIKNAAVRGAEMVRQLMIYGGQETPAFEPIDLSLLVDEMLRLLKVSISKNIILETKLGHDLPALHANPSQIRQVVMNLVTNAAEAIGEGGGMIQVTTARARGDGEASVTGSVQLPAGDYLTLEVSDTGSGMTPEVQARIFDPFFTTKSTGHGLGLAAVQGIVRSHLGAVNVVSSLGQGTRVEVLLPCAKQPVQLIPKSEAGASAG